MKRFDIMIEGHYPDEHCKDYRPDGEFVDAEIAVELLKALQELKEELFRHAEGNYFRPFLDKAEDAIAKATGETE